MPGSLVIPAPLDGLVETTARLAKPANFTRAAKNVWPFDTDRVGRVGPRPGLGRQWTFQFGSGNPIQALAQGDVVSAAGVRTSYIIVVCNGKTYVQKPDDVALREVKIATVSTGLNTTNRINVVTSRGCAYIGDGVKVVKVDLSIAESSPNTAVSNFVPVAGYPADLLTCRIMRVWRDRLIFARPPSNPHRWYMSRQADFTDFDFSDTDVGAAIGFGGFLAGQIGEPICDIADYTRDTCIFFCDHSTYIMVGEPRDGGTLERESATTGSLTADSWGLDDGDNVYFVGAGGLYRRLAQGGIEDLSTDKLTSYFYNLSNEGWTINVCFDRDRHGVWVTRVSNTSHATTSHLWYDLRRGGYWPCEFPTNCGPTRILNYDGGTAAYDRILLFGGWDGYVRVVLDGVTNDHNGTTTVDIDSYVDFGPVVPTKSELDNTRITSMDILMSEAVGGLGDANYGVTVRVRSGADAYAVANSPDYNNTRLLTGSGRAKRWLLRQPGAVHLVTFESVSGKVYAVEKVIMEVGKAGRYG
jgi:hypothetical protein